MTSYRIETIRLVNFHNFVDEVIEVRDGGHLFLLGDNGSGKTTVLDAVHYVLAGGELELNAAARLGGKRDDGRSLQGIVLRQDFERGVRNEGGAIAYAAIELHDPASGKRLSLGVGTEATTMEARVVRWGFVTTRPLAEITLLDDASIPLDREALRKQLGATHVFAPLAGYRKELARRLFGSERQYDDAVRFWGMAKAYREIVAGARDFGALFMRLLPAPDTGVFDEILRTLRAIDDPTVNAADDVIGDSYITTTGTLSYTFVLKESRRYLPKRIQFDLAVSNLLNKKTPIYGYSTGSQNTSETVFVPRDGTLTDPSRRSVGGNFFYLDPRNFTLTAKMDF